MFILRTIIISFLLPPGAFVTLFLVIACWYFSKRNRIAAIINFVFAFIIWVLSTTFFSDLLYKGLETEDYQTSISNGDVVILLTGGLTVEGHTRLFAAAEIQKALDIPVIISGIESRPEYCYDQKSNEKYLIELGVSQSKIIVEAESRNTNENAKQVSKVIKQYGFKKPILITSHYHLKRALLAFDQAGINVTPCPAGKKEKDIKCYHISDFLPKTFIHTAAAIKEYLGLICYHFS